MEILNPKCFQIEKVNLQFQCFFTCNERQSPWDCLEFWIKHESGVGLVGILN